MSDAIISDNAPYPKLTQFEDIFSEEIWASTYRDHNDTDINSTLHRVARAVASVEVTPELQVEWTDKFYSLLSNFTCTAGGRIYANAGTSYGGTTMMNCFVGPRVPHDADSLDGILTHLRAQAHTLKAEGGWGENFSYIRPRGAFIHGVGVETPGAVKYMELFDKASEIITSGSGKKSNNKKAKGKIRKGAMMAVLDCISGDTLIHTIDGKFPIRELVGTNPYVYCTDGNGTVHVRQAAKVWSKGIKSTIRVSFDNDDFIECTPDHEFMLSDGSYKAAKNLTHGDSLAALNKRLINQYLHLSVTGSRKVVAEHNCVYEMVYGEFPTIMSNSRSGRSTVAHHIDHDKLNNHPSNITQMTLTEHSRHHSDHLRCHQQAKAIAMKGKTWDEFYGVEQASDIRQKYTSKRVGSTPWNKGMKFATADTNHKVLKIENSVEQEVFDMSVPDFHNFVANGVFIHNCWHPDIIEFITAKQQPGRLTKFNISVNCTDEFMSRVLDIESKEAEIAENAGDAEFMQTAMDIVAVMDEWDLIFPDTTHPDYKTEWQGDIQKWRSSGHPVIVYNTISVKWLWNLIMDSTYNRAEPGVLFLDRANYFLPLNYAETAYATNPCGEQVLAPGGVCNLGSLNLTQFVNADLTDFDYDKVALYTKYMVRFLDNINSLTRAPLPEYEYSMHNKRRIGCGVLGWGSALYMLRTRFASAEAASLRDKVMSTIARSAYEASIDLAGEKGMFALCDPEKHAEAPFIKGLGLSYNYMTKLMTVGIRNSSLLSIQPTGNTSIFANVVSGGLEPAFMHEYIRTVIVNHAPADIVEDTPKWYEGEWCETNLFKFVKEGDEEILRGERGGVVYKIDKNRGLTKEVLCEDYGVRFMKRLGLWDPTAPWAVTAMDLAVSDHVSDLTGFARWVDSSMSKTVNVPNDYPFEQFKHIYTDTYKSGVVKGVTTYRTGTMTTVLSAKEDCNSVCEEVILDDVDLPDSLPAIRKKLRAENKKWYMTISFMDDRPVEFFVQTNHHEKTATTHDAVERLLSLARTKGIPERHVTKVAEKIAGDNNVSKLARCISFLLRHGVLIKTVVKELDHVDHVYVGSFLFAIRKYLASFIKDGEKVEGEKCQECGSSQVVYSEGCKKCLQCGSSKCG